MIVLVATDLRAEFLYGRHHRVACELETANRACGRFSVAETAGVLDDHRNVAEIGAVAGGGLDADLHGDADDRERADVAIAQCDVERSGLEGRHRDLVDDNFALTRLKFRARSEMPENLAE